MIDDVIRSGSIWGRQAAAALGGTEGALRNRRRRLAEGARDGHAEQTTALDGYEDALAAVVEAFGPDGAGGPSGECPTGA
ncbi:MAG: hypothetical protein MUD17_11010 [Gemmatimonadaceae bacterium]|jgi:hypothetical protein|nr:hypothetical protein [Gemmatimonadaceae bacterium]